MNSPGITKRLRGRRAVVSSVGAGALLLATLSVAPATTAAQQNILTNGTFESGITDWSAPFGGKLAKSSDAASGSGSLEISDRTSFQSGPTTTVKGLLTGGSAYRVQGKVKYDAGPATQNVNVTLCTASRSQCDVVASGKAAVGSWLTIDTEFAAITSAYDLLFVETPWSTEVATFKIDDFSLAAVAGAVVESPVVAGNLLPDGRFMQDTTGWTTRQGGTLGLSDDAAAGAHSLQVSARTATQSGPFADVTGKLQAGAVYRLSGSLKYTEGAESQRFNFTFCPSNFNGCADYGKSFVRGEWTTFTQEFTAEAKHNDMSWFFVETPWGSAALQDFLVDELSLVKIKDAPAPTTHKSLEEVQTKPVGDHNPLVGHKFGADPHHLIYKDRLYIYSTNDTQQYEANSKDANGLPTQSNGYGAITTLNVMSTDDMVNWVDHGSIPVAREGAAAPWSRNSWAPAAIEKDGKVYLYFCDSGTGTAVVVGGSPLGPWTDPLGKKIIPDTVSQSYKDNGGFPQGMWLFDPEIFIDDDGQGYLYFGGNSQIGAGSTVQGPQNPKSTRVVKLKDDMYTLDGDPVTIDGPGMFEASSMFKHNGKYYYSYSSNFQVKPEPGKYPTTGAIAYMMSDNPMDFSAEKYAGVAFANQGSFFGAGNGGNNHSDMFNYKGKAYFTYHAQTVGAAWAKALGTEGATQGYRSVHIDEMQFNEDGTIKPITGTNKGVDQVQNFDPYRTFEAETLAWQLGLKTAQTAEASAEFPEHNEGGNMVLSSIDAGDFSGISKVDFGKGAKKFSAKVKPLLEGGTIEVRLDTETGPVAAELPVNSTPGEWATLTADVQGATGVHDVFFVFRGAADKKLMEVDTWAFAAAETPVDPGEGGVTPTATPVATPSATPVATPSATPAATPSATPVATPSATPAAGNSRPKDSNGALAETGTDGTAMLTVTLSAIALMIAGAFALRAQHRRRNEDPGIIDH